MSRQDGDGDEGMGVDRELEMELLVSTHQKMLALVEGTKAQQEALLAKMQKVADEIKRNRLSLELGITDAIDRVGIELNQVAIEMQKNVESQSKMPAKKRGQCLATVIFASILAGLVSGFSLYYFLSVSKADRQHQLVAGKVLQASWGKLPEDARAIIIATGLGTDAGQKEAKTPAKTVKRH